MSDIEFFDEPRPGNEKYPAMLEAIKEMQLSDPAKRDSWAWLNGFKSEGTARDLAHRLRGAHPEFEFIARKGQGETVVYARLKAEVTA